MRWLGAGLTTAGAICVILTLASTKRVETLKERRDALRASEAAKAETELRKRLAAAEERQRDRTFTPEQWRRFGEVLRREPKGSCSVLFLNGNAEAGRFAEQIAASLRDNHWNAYTQAMLWPSSVPVGLQIAAQNPLDLTPAASSPQNSFSTRLKRN
ncbi:MAG: hypothetical protein ACR2G5_04930 [Pyrinomonadaceae bacterium]